MKGVADRTLELMNEYQAHTKSYQSFQHFLVVRIEELEDEKEELMEFVAIVLCWKPEWAQTSYFQKLSGGLRADLVELAKSTKNEGSGGIDDEWLDALLTKE